MCQEQHDLQNVQQHGLHICSWVALYQISSFKRIDPVIQINTTYFEIAKYQGNLPRKMGVPDSNGLSPKCFTQKETLTFVIEESGFFNLA